MKHLHISNLSQFFKNQINENTIILGDFNISLSTTDRSSNQKLNKEGLLVYNKINNSDITDI